MTDSFISGHPIFHDRSLRYGLRKFRKLLFAKVGIIADLWVFFY